jgi:DNA (cytosine-5)-methyltransferase 1
VQEYARIQQFPDDWQFHGKTLQKYKQIGNAVPVGLGFAAGVAIREHLNGADLGKNVIGFNYSRYNGTDHLSFIQRFADIVSRQPSLELLN